MGTEGCCSLPHRGARARSNTPALIPQLCRRMTFCYALTHSPALCIPRPLHSGAEQRLKQYHINNLEVVHVRGDPRSMNDMRRLVPLSAFKAAVVVSDSLWWVARQFNKQEWKGMLWVWVTAALVCTCTSLLLPCGTWPSQHRAPHLATLPQVRRRSGRLRGRPVAAQREPGEPSIPACGLLLDGWNRSGWKLLEGQNINRQAAVLPWHGQCTGVWHGCTS